MSTKISVGQEDTCRITISEECKKYGYKCADRVEFLEKAGIGRNCWIKLNDSEVSIPYNEVIFLMYLAMELKKGRGGWVSGEKLVEKNVTRDYPDTQRTMHDLRQSLKHYLLEKREKYEKDFLGNDRKGNYRLSIPPNRVFTPNAKWLPASFNQILDLVLKERKRRKVWDSGISK